MIGSRRSRTCVVGRDCDASLGCGIPGPPNLSRASNRTRDGVVAHRQVPGKRRTRIADTGTRLSATGVGGMEADEQDQHGPFGRGKAGCDRASRRSRDGHKGRSRGVENRTRHLCYLPFPLADCDSFNDG